MHAPGLREALDAVYARFNRPELIDPDPLGPVRAYADPADREVVGLLAACLAYGRVRSILNSLERLLPQLNLSPGEKSRSDPVARSCRERAPPGSGPGHHRKPPSGRRGLQDAGPAAWLHTATSHDLERAARGFKHRWTTGRDVTELLKGIQAVRKSHGSLQACFIEGLGENDPDVRAALGHLVAQLREGGGACRLLADPAAGSACKRLHLYLRWMVREDTVDPGGWRPVPASLLIVPLDTHMHRVGLAFGFTRRKQADGKTALEITGGFRRVNPDDPVRYDFALTRPGIRDGFDLRELGRDPVKGLRGLADSARS